MSQTISRFLLISSSSDSREESLISSSSISILNSSTSALSSSQHLGSISRIKSLEADNSYLESGRGDHRAYTSALTIAEVVSKAAREGRESETAYDILTSNSEIIDVDHQLSLKASADESVDDVEGVVNPEIR